eukprot:TRINITY_DN890_c0_g1_i2.p1 TRINITY_DN890_c0_g1~~TRINITY_DN890_c0_g1_i2.p1  ORF type:complete len:569 (+),score=181.92 TRINITY_DN890_c0_g1_i2:1877-3583(+)
MLEMSLPAWLRYAFVAEYEEDKEIFLKELVDAKRLVLSVTYLPQKPVVRREHNLDDYRKFGAEAWLDELFAAPDLVRDAIIENSGVAHVAVFNDKNYAKQIAESPLLHYYTPESRYDKTRSRYGGNDSTAVSGITPSKVFSSGVDESMKQELMDEHNRNQTELKAAEAEVGKLMAAETAAQKALSDLKKQKDTLNASKKKYDTVTRQLAFKKTQLEELMKAEDTTKEEASLRNQIANLGTRRFKTVLELVGIMRQHTDSLLKVDKVLLKRVEANALSMRLANEVALAESAYANKKREMEQIEREFTRARERTKELRDKAESIALLTEELKAAFDGLPNTTQELDEAIETVTLAANAIFQTNPEVIRLYEKRQKEIQELEERLGGNVSEADHLRDKITTVRSQWEPPLEELVGQIKGSFSKFFAEIGCAGDVVLSKHEDFKEWGLELRVKFRNTDNLAALTAHLQSGGERSVATMLFLISLQHITPVPFRVVDEINQGMDPHNERMIFSQVVHSATRPGLPQYFLITPKLLPDLEWTSAMTVLCVFNGPWMLSQEDWEDVSTKRLARSK